MLITETDESEDLTIGCSTLTSPLFWPVLTFSFTTSVPPSIIVVPPSVMLLAKFKSFADKCNLSRLAKNINKMRK